MTLTNDTEKMTNYKILHIWNCLPCPDKPNVYDEIQDLKRDLLQMQKCTHCNAYFLKAISQTVRGTAH